MTATQHAAESDRPVGRLRPPLVLCGIGFGGFFDGIVFHQILQLHHMLSNAGEDRIGLSVESTTVSGIEINILWDGIFHAATYLALLAGVVWLWSRWQQGPPERPTWRLLVGSLLVGWGLFNVVEGIINHHILAIHHVVEGRNSLVFDLAFLATGVVMIAIGRRLTTRPRKAPKVLRDDATGDVNTSQ